MPRTSRLAILLLVVLAGSLSVPVAAQSQDSGKQAGERLTSIPPNTWVKLSPLESTPPSPRLGYEGACVWDAKHQVMIRYGGHNQGGGGEQGSEIWTFDPLAAKWTIREPNTSPPGICCGQQNVFDPVSGRYIRFPAFSASHGWQWMREVYLNDSSVWTYDLGENKWRNMRPLPTAHPRPLRCASYDTDRRVIVLFGGEGSHEGTWTYDPWTNEWKKMSPPEEPAPRSGGNMAYDQKHKLHILFGAQFDDDQHTWAYDLAKNEWRDMQPPQMPPTDKNDAVLTYDASAGQVLAIAKVTTGKDEEATHALETWAYDAGENRWTKMNPQREPDPTGNRARQLMFAPELGVALLENRAHGKVNEQQIWAYRLPPGDKGAGVRPPAAKPAAYPPLVVDVVVSVIDQRHVEISWQAPLGAEITGYLVERAPVEVLSEDQLKRLKSQTPPLASPSVGLIRRIGKFERITKAPVSETRFSDTLVSLGQKSAIDGEPIEERRVHDEELDASGREYACAVYAYRLRFLDAVGGASGPSPATFTIPSAPQHFFAKEEGTACHLKWEPNPEKGIAGYRVYRMDGRYNKDPIVRLTEQPIAKTSFTDPDAGKGTRRYYVVAVDALGQEGFPSSPVWFNREWQPFYEPFVGEWHQ
ncbi:MAG TPA: hypothetical protein VMP01_13565 [Pirellulaceae bacterium]|nr:hypothetical protein [Pirellulaceae bacterium]